MTSPKCFSPNELQRFALGTLPEDSSDAIATHLEKCPPCEETVAAFDKKSDTLIRSLQQAPGAKHDSVPAYEQAIRNVKSLTPTDATDEHVGVDRIRDYELLDSIGEGGMGTVYKARHTKLNRIVALKLLPARKLADEQAVGRFQREMLVVGQLNHPAIVQATDAGEMNGTHFLAMEFVDGFDLSQIVSLTGPLDIADACEIVRAAAIGLQHAHEQDMVHRDIKPSNIMVASDGQVKILDLGLALLGGMHGVVDELTTVGQLMGTLDYMAPEQCDNSHAVDRRADIYSLGATLYKLLTSAAPYADERWTTPVQKLKALANESVPELTTRRDDVPDALTSIVHRCLAGDPEKRFASMDELAAELEPFCDAHALVDVCQNAADRHREREEKRPTTPSFVNPFTAQHTNVGEVAISKPAMQRRHGGWKNVAVGVAMLIAFVAAGVILYLNTDRGQIVIETVAPGVEVSVTRAGKPYKRQTLTQKTNTLLVGAGDYEVTLTGEHDGLEVDGGTITLTRNGTKVASIVERERPVNADVFHDDDGNTAETNPNDRGPLYDGKSYAEWEQVIQNDRSIKRIVDAMQAIMALKDDDPLRAAKTIVGVARTHKINTLADTPNGKVHIEEYMNHLMQTKFDKEIRRATFLNELETGNAKSREYVLRRPYVFVELHDVNDADSALKAVLAASRDKNDDVSCTAIRVLGAVKTESAQARVHEGLTSSNMAIKLECAAAIVEKYRSNERHELVTPKWKGNDKSQVVTVLKDVLKNGTASQQLYAATIATWLANDAAELRPQLIAIVKSDEPKYWEKTKQLPGQLERVYLTGYPFATSTIRDAAIVALGAIGIESDELTSLLDQEPTRRAKWYENNPVDFSGPSFDFVAAAHLRLKHDGSVPPPTSRLGGSGKGGFPANGVFSSSSSDEPVYGGKTLAQYTGEISPVGSKISKEQLTAIKALAPEAEKTTIEQYMAPWKHVIQTDRSPSQVENAAGVLAALGGDRLSAELADLFISVARGRGRQQWRSADNSDRYFPFIEILSQLDSKDLARVLKKELAGDDADMLRLAIDTVDMSGDFPAFKPLLGELVAIASKEQPKNIPKNWTLHRQALFVAASIDADDERVVKALHAGLDDHDTQHTWRVVSTILGSQWAQEGPDASSEKIDRSAEALIKFAGREIRATRNDSYRNYAGLLLKLYAKRSNEAAVKAMIDLIADKTWGTNEGDLHLRSRLSINTALADVARHLTPGQLERAHEVMTAQSTIAHAAWNFADVQRATQRVHELAAEAKKKAADKAPTLPPEDGGE